jgi:hypothetical protein
LKLVEGSEDSIPANGGLNLTRRLLSRRQGLPIVTGSTASPPSRLRVAIYTCTCADARNRTLSEASHCASLQRRSWLNHFQHHASDRALGDKIPNRCMRHCCMPLGFPAAPSYSTESQDFRSRVSLRFEHHVAEAEALETDTSLRSKRNNLRTLPDPGLENSEHRSRANVPERRLGRNCDLACRTKPKPHNLTNYTHHY